MHTNNNAQEGLKKKQWIHVSVMHFNRYLLCKHYDSGGEWQEEKKKRDCIFSFSSYKIDTSWCAKYVHSVTMINSFLPKKWEKCTRMRKEWKKTVEQLNLLIVQCSFWVCLFTWNLKRKNGCLNEMYHHYWNRCHRLLFGKYSRLCF